MKFEELEALLLSGEKVEDVEEVELDWEEKFDLVMKFSGIIDTGDIPIDNEYTIAKLRGKAE